MADATQALIERYGFNFVALEADWPDVARIDGYVRNTKLRESGARATEAAFSEAAPFSRFPTWMWRNLEFKTFVSWLRAHNLAQADHTRRVALHGLDLYSMFTSMAAVLAYLDGVDPEAARVARARYGTLTPWQKDPAAYGKAVLMGQYTSSEQAVVAMLRDMLARRLDYSEQDGARFFDAAQNARVVADAESYYRAMYYGSAVSWNLRDMHMFEILQSLFRYHGPDARGVVWEHNSHVGDAAATEMSSQGKLNLGELCRQSFGNGVYIVGFGTDHGTVAAASGWDEPLQKMRVQPSHPKSYERLFHQSGVPVHLVLARAKAQRPARGASPPTPRARHRRDLSPGNRACEPLLLRELTAPV